MRHPPPRAPPQLPNCRQAQSDPQTDNQQRGGPEDRMRGCSWDLECAHAGGHVSSTGDLTTSQRAQEDTRPQGSAPDVARKLPPARLQAHFRRGLSACPPGLARPGLAWPLRVLLLHSLLRPGTVYPTVCGGGAGTMRRWDGSHQAFPRHLGPGVGVRGCFFGVSVEWPAVVVAMATAGSLHFNMMDDSMSVTCRQVSVSGGEGRANLVQ